MKQSTMLYNAVHKYV